MMHRPISKESPVAPAPLGDVARLLSRGEPAAQEDTRIRWLDWPADKAALEDHWRALVEQASEPNSFHEPWALGAALDAFGGEHVRLFTLWHDVAGVEALLGLLPMDRTSRYGRWRFPHVRGWLHSNAFLGTPLIAKGQEYAFWRALLAAIDEEPARDLFFHIEGLALGGPVEQALIDVAGKGKRPIGLVQREERAFLSALDDPAAYFEEAVRGKKRKELRRQKRRLEEEGALTFERLEGEEALGVLPSWTDEFLALEKAGWKGENGSALACAPETETMFRDMLRGAAMAGKLQLVALRFDGRAIAMLVNLLAAPGAFSFKTAFDEGFARYSPGVLLQEYNLGLMTQPGIDWCDSCAAEDHPMIDHLWRERRAVGRYSVGIGGPLRRRLFAALLAVETKRVAARRKDEEIENND